MSNQESFLCELGCLGLFELCSLSCILVLMFSALRGNVKNSLEELIFSICPRNEIEDIAYYISSYPFQLHEASVGKSFISISIDYYVAVCIVSMRLD